MVRANIPFRQGNQLARLIRPNEVDPGEARAPIEGQRREEQRPRSEQSSILDDLTSITERLMPVTTCTLVMCHQVWRIDQKKTQKNLNLPRKKTGDLIFAIQKIAGIVLLYNNGENLQLYEKCVM